MQPIPNTESAHERRSAASLPWQRAAWVAGLFSLVVGFSMLVGHFDREAIDPLKSPELKEAKEKLRLDPTDEGTKQKIRTLDLQLRQQYFRQLSQMGSGVYLLLGGIAVFVISVGQWARYRKRFPMPGPKKESVNTAAAMARWTVAACGLVVGSVLFALTLGQSTALPKRAAEAEKVLGGSPVAEGVSDAATAE